MAHLWQSPSDIQFVPKTVKFNHLQLQAQTSIDQIGSCYQYNSNLYQLTTDRYVCPCTEHCYYLLRHLGSQYRTVVSVDQRHMGFQSL